MKKFISVLLSIFLLGQTLGADVSAQSMDPEAPISESTGEQQISSDEQRSPEELLNELLSDHEGFTATSTSQAVQDESGILPSSPKQQPKTFTLQNLEQPFVNQLSGAAEFQVPLMVPTGINGLTPELTLSYSSQLVNENGPFGMGWELELGQIKRLNKQGVDMMYQSPIYHANLPGINGELVKISGANGINEYRLRKEGSFAKLVLDTNTNSWTVKSKDGMTYRLGLTDESRLHDVSDEMTYSWHLSQIEDLHGNQIDCTWYRVGSLVYPKSISYGAPANGTHPFKIRFLPFDTNPGNFINRNDQRTDFSMGFKVVYGQLMTGIEVLVQNQQRMKYDLMYTYSHHLGRSDLDSITITGTNGAEITTQELSFDYFTPEDGADPTGIAYKHGFLRQINFFQGSTIEYDYLPTNQFYTSLNAIANARPHYPMIAVKTLKKKDFTGRDDTWNFFYQDGAFFADTAVDRQMAGFGRVTVTDPLNQKTVTYFTQGGGFDGSSLGENPQDNDKTFTGRWSFIGQPYRSETYDAQGHLIQLSITKWESSQLGTLNRYFPRATAQVSSLFNTAGAKRSTASTTLYDLTNGNVLEQRELGEVDANNDGTYTDLGTDDRKTLVTYASNPTKHLLAFPKTQELYDHGGTLISKSESEYDGLPLGQVDKGNVTKSSGINLSNNQKLTTNNSYLPTGQLSSTTDPRGNSTTITYDSTGIFPEQITNALGQTTIMVYDLLFAQPIRTTDPNGLVAETDLDGLGRPIESRMSDPNSGNNLVTMQTTEYLESSFPHSVKTTVHLDSSTTASSYSYLDGFGRAIQTRTPSDNAGTIQYAVTNTSYDALGLAIIQTLPVFFSGTSYNQSQSSSVTTTTTYDVLNRPLTVTDGNGTTSFSYDIWTSTVTDANGNSKTTETDAFGRLVKVIEVLQTPNSQLQTSYAYDARDLLTKLTDAQGNVRHFFYDSLGRMTSQEDLHAQGDSDFGVYSYSYDDNGNVLSITNPKGQVISSSYDALNRALTQTPDSSVNSESYSFSYDQGTNGIGRMTSISSSLMNWTAGYDRRGRITNETSTIAGVNYNKSYTYTRFDQPSTVSYPDGTQISFAYNSVGQISSIDSNNAQHIITSVSYNPINQVTDLVYGNGISSTMSYDANKMYRMTGKLTRKTTTVQSNWWNQWMARTPFDIPTLFFDTSTEATVGGRVERSMNTTRRSLWTFAIPNAHAETAAQKRLKYRMQRSNPSLQTPNSSLPTPVIPNAQLESLFNDRSNDATAAPVQQNSLLQQLLNDRGFGFNDPILDPVTGQLTMPSQQATTQPVSMPTGTNGKSEITFQGDANGDTNSMVNGIVFLSSTYSNLDPNAEPATGFQLIINKNGRFYWQDNGYQSLPTPLAVGQSTPTLSYDLSALDPDAQTGNLAQYSFQFRFQLASGFVTPPSDPVMFTLDPNHVPSDPVGSTNSSTPTDPNNPPAPPAPAPILVAPTGDIYQNLVYSYDAVGNITRLEERAEVPGKKVADFSYDDLYRLTQAQITGSTYTSNNATPYSNYSETYAYNAIGNILNKSDQGDYTYAQPGKVNPQAVTRIEGADGTQTFTYDDNGNLTKHQTDSTDGKTTIKSFQWDHYNRMTKSTVVSADGSTNTTKYDYDQTGRRIRKQNEYTAPGASFGTVSTTVYPFADFEVTDLGNTKTTVMANNMHVATVEYNQGAREIYFSHTDHLGGGNIITDEQGHFVQSLDYKPFGSVRIDEKYSDFDERRKYTGHELDDETGLYYAQARYYNSDIGRFVSQDLVASKAPQKLLSDPQQLNFYSYTRNHPINAIDPDGKLTIFVHGTVSDPSTFSSLFMDTVATDLGEQTRIVNMPWSGGNTVEDRSKGAKFLQAIVNNYQFEDGEQLNIVAHSHGGNVAIEAINSGLNVKVNNLVLFATPNRSDYQVENKNSIENFYNLFTRKDSVQILGAWSDKWLPPNWRLNNSIDPRVREDGARNIRVLDPGEKSEVAPGNSAPIGSHTSFHTLSDWDPVAEKLGLRDSSNK